jgi:S1-C subfamily serine protease
VLFAVLAAAALVVGVAVGHVTATNGSSSSPAAASFPSGSGSTGNGSFGNGFGNANGGNGSSSNGSGGGGFGGFGNGNGNGFGSGGSSGGSGGSAAANGVASKVSPAVVNINTVLGDSGAAAGTGMIVTSSGEVITNNHVIDGATQISVELADGSTHSAKVLGYDAGDDVALIKVNGVSGLPTVSAGSTSSLSVGDPVVAIGNAGGKGGAPSVVTGSITGLNQTITASDDNGANPETLHKLIQTDAPIQPGDSGGPLVNADGKVIGMDAAASATSGFGFRQAASSEGYAIPIDNALSIAQQIAAGNETSGVHIGERGILGVAVQPDSVSSGDFGGGNGFGSSGNSGTSSNGALIQGVQSNSPADNAGLRQGDTIVGVAGNSIRSASQLENAMNRYHPGDKVSISWVDGSGSRHSATLQLVAGPPA